MVLKIFFYSISEQDSHLVNFLQDNPNCRHVTISCTSLQEIDTFLI